MRSAKRVKSDSGEMDPEDLPDPGTYVSTETPETTDGPDDTYMVENPVTGDPGMTDDPEVIEEPELCVTEDGGLEICEEGEIDSRELDPEDLPDPGTYVSTETPETTDGSDDTYMVENPVTGDPGMTDDPEIIEEPELCVTEDGGVEICEEGEQDPPEVVPDPEGYVSTETPELTGHGDETPQIEVDPRYEREVSESDLAVEPQVDSNIVNPPYAAAECPV